MSDKICEALGLPKMSDIFNDDTTNPDMPEIPEVNKVTEVAVALSDASTANAVVHHVQDEDGTVEHNGEMNEIYSEAMRAYRDLMDLSMNMEAKNAGTVAEQSATFLKIALDASRSKSDTKARKLKMKLDREKFELSKNNNNDAEVIDVTEESFMASRNDLLKFFKQKNEQDK